MVEGLDVAMRGAEEGGGRVRGGVQGRVGGREGVGICYVVICCCGGEMYCSAWRLAPRISYIMSVQRLLLTGREGGGDGEGGASLLETTYRRKCHTIG